VVIGQRLYTVDELCEQGHLQSSEREWMGHFAKYLAKVAKSVGAAS
jgi:hypothetical protein